MLRARVIPCLLIHRGGLVKTFRFKKPKYVGDPLNAVRIFNDKQVDELLVLDIDATVNNIEPDYSLISNIAAECRMPLCYGGGIKNVDQIERIISLGVEKIAISSSLIDNHDLIAAASERVGSQSVVAVLDVKQNMFGKYFVVTHNARRNHKISPLDLALKYQSQGVGEILFNSVDRDGTLLGYDFAFLDTVCDELRIPITVLGGASSYDDIRSVAGRYGPIGISAGSIFVFKGKYKAVLIQYPQPDLRDQISSVN